MKNTRYLFVGSLNRGEPPWGGGAAKNQILYSRLKNDFQDDITVFDVSFYRKNKIIGAINLLRKILKYDHIILSVSDETLTMLGYIIPKIIGRKISVFIMGGRICDNLKSTQLNKFLEHSQVVYVETNEMKVCVSKRNSKIPVKLLPNFRQIPEIPKIEFRPISDEVRLVYLARINKEKGIFRCFEVVNQLNKTDPNRTYYLDIYGGIEMNDEERKKFDSVINSNNNIEYKGILNLQNKSGHISLSNYHFLLFLTTHPGEGFPGTIIDAMISQVPVIASDWRYNAEILQDDIGYLGDLIPVDDNIVVNTVESINKLIDNTDCYNSILSRMNSEAKVYNINNLDLNIQ